MLSFENMYKMCQDFAQDTTSAATTFFKLHINVGQRILETELGSYITEENHTDSTVDGTNSYNLPARYVRLKVAYITENNIRYRMLNVTDENEWQALQANQAATSESDIAQKIIVRTNTYEIWPTPATSGNTITLVYEASSIDLQFDDYTDGTISDLANADTTVTGSGTTFTAAMAGRWIKINSDGVWYKINSFTNATSIELDRNFEGTTISSGSEAYTIGQMPITPSDTHHIPVYYAMMHYYLGFKQNSEKGSSYKALYESEMDRAKATHSRRYSSKYIKKSPPGLTVAINPNDYPILS